MNRPTAITLVALLFLALTVPSSAQDLAKPPSGEATAQVQQEAETMTLKTFSCAGACGFSVTSRSEEEIIGIVIAHARTFHKKELTPDEVKAKLAVQQPKQEKTRKKER